MSEDKTKLLRQIEIFSPLTDEELEQVIHMFTIRSFKKNEIILYEEDTNEYMYAILTGRVKVFKTTPDGKEIILAVHGTGEFFGEISLIDGNTEPATVMAMEDSVISLISRKNFYTLMLKNEKIVQNLLLIMCQRFRDAWKKIQVLNFNNASQRIKILFMTLSEQHGRRVEDGIMLDLKLTHQEIADMAGLSRETVTRVLDRWREEGLIKIIRRKHIKLLPEFLKMDSLFT
ncbi:MAG TPA: Crp/Fnr family transcriptional regulator [Nitrospirae bacterium]|nr:Crp/Fnr family transcriptional regulator [Nitrospirota bacterium]